MNTIKNILFFILLFIWQLPQNLVALVMMPFLGSLSKICYRNYCYCFLGDYMRGGISLGNFAFVSESISKYEPDIAHEVDGHTVQSKILGPLYLIVIGIPSICWAYFRNKKKHPNYYAFYTESWANECAGLEVFKPYEDYEIYKVRFKDKGEA